ncbi:MAG: amidohydrolase family protein [Mariniphaga sp.]
MVLDTLPVVDTHEHLASINSLSKSKTLDFMWLFHQYADDDIKAAGMSKPQFFQLMSDSMIVSEKWEILQPYYEASFNTAYNRVTLLSVNHLFRVKEFNEKTVHLLTDKLREVNQIDWYNTVLRDRCNIQFVINDSRPIPGNPDFFRYTTRFDYFQLDSKAKIEQLAREHNTSINSLDDLNATLRMHFVKAVGSGLTTIKNSLAYYRSLYYEDVGHERAEEVFSQVMATGDVRLDPETAKPLADYMMYRILDLALEFKKPVQIHTGLQAGYGNYIMNSNPALLANLFLKYRDVKFAIFHGGYPYVGYYENIENVYGQLLFAREIIGNVLIEKVKSRYFTEEDEALKVARVILHDNVVSLFDLKH